MFPSHTPSSSSLEKGSEISLLREKERKTKTKEILGDERGSTLF